MVAGLRHLKAISISFKQSLTQSLEAGYSVEDGSKMHFLSNT